jgi:REP element-mobilizing transposase RayT
MTYDPSRHHRRSIRLKGYDYTSPGAYFVTICVRGGECLLGEVVDGKMQLNEWGRVVGYYWGRMPRHFPHVELDAWVVMPNHVHGIIVITDRPTGRGEASLTTRSLPESAPPGPVSSPAKPVSGDASPLRPTGASSGSLGAIVGNFKSVTTRRINRMRKTPGMPVWQRNYWEHIVRDGKSLNRIREYIRTNAARWADDQLHPAAPPNPFKPSP